MEHDVEIKGLSPETRHSPQLPTSSKEHDAPSSYPWKGAISAILLCVATSLVLTFVTVTTPPLTEYGTYTPALLTVYTTVSTIIATIVTAHVATHTQLCLLRIVDKKLQILERNVGDLETRLDKLNSLWKTILGIGELAKNLRITAVILATALITTCITASFTPTMTAKVIRYNSRIPSGEPFIFARPWPVDDMPYGTQSDLVWDLHNGSNFLPWGGRGGSPAQEGIPCMSSINIQNPDVYAFVDQGVAVHSSAVGTPLSMYWSQDGPGAELPNLLQRYEGSVERVTACVPVMVRNPYTCRPGGTIFLDNSTKEMVLKSDNGLCNVTGKDQMLKIQCLWGSVGQGAILLGARDGYASWLAAAVGLTPVPRFLETDTFSVQCNIDARNSFEYRNVELALLGKENSMNRIYKRYLKSLGLCSPSHPSSIRDPLYATAATANLIVLRENVLNSGWFRTINTVTSASGGYGVSANDSIRSAPFGFPASENALEDVFGLTAAMVSARTFMNSSLIETEGTAIIPFLRVGPGGNWALVYAILPLLCAVMLGYLVFSGRGEAGRFKSSDMKDLISLGREMRAHTV